MKNRKNAMPSPDTEFVGRRPRGRRYSDPSTLNLLGADRHGADTGDLLTTC